MRFECGPRWPDRRAPIPEVRNLPRTVIPVIRRMALIFPQHGRVDQHAHGYEKDRPKEVFEGLDEVFYLFGVQGLARIGTHNKGARGAEKPAWVQRIPAHA